MGGSQDGRTVLHHMGDACCAGCSKSVRADAHSRHSGSQARSINRVAPPWSACCCRQDGIRVEEVRTIRVEVDWSLAVLTMKESEKRIYWQDRRGVIRNMTMEEYARTSGSVRSREQESATREDPGQSVRPARGEDPSEAHDPQSLRQVEETGQTKSASPISGEAPSVTDEQRLPMHAAS